MANINLFKKQKNFVDISLAFEPNSVTSDITVLKNERAINQAIKNIILFTPGEVPFQQDMGSRVNEYLFETCDEGIAGLIAIEIERAINYNEPRVSEVDAKVEAQPDQHQFVANIYYKIVGYEQQFKVTQLLRVTR